VYRIFVLRASVLFVRVIKKLAKVLFVFKKKNFLGKISHILWVFSIAIGHEIFILSEI